MFFLNEVTAATMNSSLSPNIFFLSITVVNNRNFLNFTAASRILEHYTRNPQVPEVSKTSTLSQLKRKSIESTYVTFIFHYFKSGWQWSLAG